MFAEERRKWNRWEARDLVALVSAGTLASVVIISCFIAVLQGLDELVQGVMLAAIGATAGIVGAYLGGGPRQRRRQGDNDGRND